MPNYIKRIYEMHKRSNSTFLSWIKQYENVISSANSARKAAAVDLIGGAVKFIKQYKC